jgi:hypothetical protein
MGAVAPWKKEPTFQNIAQTSEVSLNRINCSQCGEYVHYCKVEYQTV